MAELEHINITVSDAQATADMLKAVFGWHERWRGEVMNGSGTGIHMGTKRSYIAIFSPHAPTVPARDSYTTNAGLNHIAVTVEDIDAMEAKVKAAGYEPLNHADYEPGRRFYFHDGDDIEWEVVSYT